VNLDLFAGVRVSDIVAARPWYERLLGGEPAFFPNEIEAVWVLAEHQYLYLLEDRSGAGRALVTVMVDDLDATVAAFPGGARKVITTTPTATRLASATCRPAQCDRRDGRRYRRRSAGMASIR
jgi:hypothetical protein